MPVPFTLPQEDACKFGIQCPIQKDKTYVDSVSLEILPEYPSVIDYNFYKQK